MARGQSATLLGIIIHLPFNGALNYSVNYGRIDITRFRHPQSTYVFLWVGREFFSINFVPWSVQ